MSIKSKQILYAPIKHQTKKSIREESCRRNVLSVELTGSKLRLFHNGENPSNNFKVRKDNTSSKYVIIK